MDFETFLRQDLSIIKKELNLEIVKCRSKYGKTILHELFSYSSTLPEIKYIFNFCKNNLPSLFLEKDHEEYDTILTYMLIKDIALSKVKYVFKFCTLNFPTLFLKVNRYQDTVLHELFYHPLSMVKYGLNFFKKNHPILFLTKNRKYEIFLECLFDLYSDLPKIEYAIKFLIKHFPFLFLQKHVKNIRLHLMYEKYDCEVLYLYKFYKYNFPEKSKRKNNFILPLMMEIQN